METNDLFLNEKEHKFYKKYKSFLEKKYDVKIYIPDVQNTSSLGDIIFGTIVGVNHNLEIVKGFISKKVNRPIKCSENAELKSITVVTLSDSEEEECTSGDDSIDKSWQSTSVSSNPQEDSIFIIESTVGPKMSLSCGKANPVELIPSTSLENSIYIIENTVDAKESKDEAELTVSSASLEDSICILEKSCHSEKTAALWTDVLNKKSKFETMKRCRKNECRKVSPKQVLSSCSGAEDLDICKVSSTTEEPDLKRPRLCNDSEISLNAFPSKSSEPEPEFISLNQKNELDHRGKVSSYTKKKPKIAQQKKEADIDIIILDEPEIKKPSEEVAKNIVPRRLRPIVIDGSNVAREHGKVTDTFSSKGIKLCIDYFLKRGHTEVTAFIPKYRRHGERRKFCPTTDSSILEELAKSGKLVFTPSRRLDDRCYASYDDRFVVDLASQNDGVIVSNDNFKDLLDVSEKFKEAIENRLLMYCFVGDIFMVPDDPLGRNGPTLNEYLSFPIQKEAN